jgi:adenylate cyclase
LSLQPNDLHVAMMASTTFHATGEADDLRRAAEHCLGIAQRRLTANPHDDRAAYAGAYALAELARSDEARQWLALAVSFDVDDSRTYFNLACVYSLLGDIDRSLGYLRRTLATTDSQRKVLYARFHCPDFRNVRADPRFGELFSTGTD